MASNEQSPATRASLILRLRNREDLVAWREFVELYQPLVHALAVRRGLQSTDADDVTQEVLTRVAKSIDDWNPDPQRGSFRGWLATITRNVAVQFFRETNRRPAVGLNSEEGEPMEPAGSDDHKEFEREHERQLFAWAARKVQERFERKTWRAFWLTAVDGQPVAAVTAQLEMTAAQIYVARSRVMRQLRKTIEQSEFDSRGRTQ